MASRGVRGPGHEATAAILTLEARALLLVGDYRNFAIYAERADNHAILARRARRAFSRETEEWPRS